MMFKTAVTSSAVIPGFVAGVHAAQKSGPGNKCRDDKCIFGGFFPEPSPLGGADFRNVIFLEPSPLGGEDLRNAIFLEPSPLGGEGRVRGLADV